MDNGKIPRSFGTHDGTFHADEVTACALLLVFNLIDKDKIVRSRNIEELSKCEYVCDVGGVYNPPEKLFDHHQADYQGQLSSAGMVLLHLRDSGAISDLEYRFFDHSLINGVDAHDNGKDPQIPGLCTYSNVVSNFTPIPYDVSPAVQDKAFFDALDFAYGHLSRLWNRFQYMHSCREVISEIMAKNEECLFFEKSLPWLEIFFELGGISHPAKFVIMPSGKFWKLRGIPPNLEDKMKVRIPLPLEWAGLMDQDLKQISGIPGAIFCHKGRFISVWETKEDAFKALEYTLKKR